MLKNKIKCSETEPFIPGLSLLYQSGLMITPMYGGDELATNDLHDIAVPLPGLEDTSISMPCYVYSFNISY